MTSSHQEETSRTLRKQSRMEPEGLTAIEVNNHQLRESTQEVIEVLDRANDPTQVFRWGGVLARVRVDERGRPITEPFDKDTMLHHMSLVADFFVARRSKDGQKILVSTSIAILTGKEDLSQWSDEELERGQRRGKDGKFRKPPTIIAKAVHDELVKRRMSKAYDLLRESTYDAVKVLVEVAKDENADTATRVKAAELILDRTLGKAPQHVSLDFQGDVPWKQLMAQAVVGSVEQARALLEEGDVVDGEVVEDTG
jgi:hypothetical protein